MNKQRRKELGAIVSILEKNPDNEQLQNCLNELDRIMNDEQEYFDNMPENLQGSMRGIESEDAISSMEEALDAMNDAQEVEGEERADLIDTAIQCIEEAQF